MEPGQLDPGTGDGQYYHKVPVDNKFYMGTQCFHCEKAPCTKACPTKATWKEPDGIVVVDYDWCIGCRYCMVACPFQIPAYEYADAVTPRVMKCNLCAERTLKEGKQPACVEICPTGVLTFGRYARDGGITYDKLAASPVQMREKEHA